MNHNVIQTNCLFDNRWLKVYEQTIDSDGKKHKWLYTSRGNPLPAKEKQPDAVVVLAITGQGKLLITKEFRYPLMDYEIGFPAGLIEDIPANDAIREVKEETGLLFNPIVQSPVVYSSAGMTDESVVYVLGTVTGDFSNINLQDHEDIVPSFVDEKELGELIQKPCSARAWPFFLVFHFMGIKEVFSKITE